MRHAQPSLLDELPTGPPAAGPDFGDAVARFRWQGRPTARGATVVAGDGRTLRVDTFTNEFWTSRQRAGSSLHEISYRACFKPQLVDFFVERLTRPGDLVYDPFMGRGTTVIEAALLDRAVAGCDVNPLSRVLVKPRLAPPTVEQVRERLDATEWTAAEDPPDDLHVFYHPDTLRELCGLRAYLGGRRNAGALDGLDEWIEMVAVNRLTGHSRGFFSVYTMPPNQAVSVRTQRDINARRGQAPEPRDVRRIICKKTQSLLRDCDAAARLRLARRAAGALLLTGPADRTAQIASSSVALVVTSPPFLNVVNYAADNWLRCWFCGIDPAAVRITMARRLDDWQAAMSAVFGELGRVLRPGGHVAFEVGEVKGGTLRLEEAVIPCGASAGLAPIAVVVNDQTFTKTANCWGVSNNRKGTNTNRIVVFRKPAPVS